MTTTRGWWKKRSNPWALPGVLIAGLILLALVSGCSAAKETAPPFQTPSAVPSKVVVAATAASSVTPAPAEKPTATVFRLPTNTPTRTQAPEAARPSATPDCTDSLRYIEDLTVPDGAIVSAGTVFDKRWRVENNGSCNWNEFYILERLSGSSMGLGDRMALYPARAGSQAVIRMLLTAPSEPGAYRSAWQAVDPDGQYFGDPIFVDIIVAVGNP